LQERLFLKNEIIIVPRGPHGLPEIGEGLQQESRRGILAMTSFSNDNDTHSDRFSSEYKGRLSPVTVTEI